MARGSTGLPGSEGWTIDPKCAARPARPPLRAQVPTARARRTYDPMLPFLLAVPGLPALAALALAAPAVLSACGTPAPWALAAVRGSLACAAVWLLVGVARVQLVRRRACKAVQHLPGPHLPGFFGILGLLAKRRDAHRVLTELAEQHGPLFRLQSGFSQVPAAARVGLRPRPAWRTADVWRAQFLVICDPFLAAECLRSPHVDKFAVVYSFLQNVSGVCSRTLRAPCRGVALSAPACAAARRQQRAHGPVRRPLARRAQGRLARLCHGQDARRLQGAPHGAHPAAAASAPGSHPL